MADTNLRILVTVQGGQAAAAEIKGVAGATGEVGAATETTSKKTSGLMQSLKGVAAGIAVYKGYSFVKGAISTTEQLAKSTASLQRVTGLDTRTASGWVTMAQERGVQAKQLNMGFATLGRQMESAGKNSKTAGAAFTNLGIPLDKVRKMNTQQTMGAVADALARMPPGAEKAAAAQKLFGRAGQGLLPILNGGSKALNEQVAAMGKASGMTTASEKSALNLAKQQRELSASMLGVKVAVGTALIPILSGAAKAFTPLAQAFAHFMQVSPAFRTAIYAVTGALIALKIAMFFGAGGVTAGIIAAIVGIGIALVMLYNKCAWFRNAVNAVWGAIRAGAVAVWNAIKPLVGFVVDAWMIEIKLFVLIARTEFNIVKAVVTGAINAVKAIIRTVPGVARSVFNAVVGAARAVVGGFAGAGRAAASAFSGGLRTIVGLAKGVWSAISAGARAAASAISGVLGGAFNAVKSAASGVLSTIQSISSAASSVSSIPGKLLSKIPGAAEGGVRTTSGLTLVGERGPEIVSLPRGSAVYPNGAVPSGFAGGAVIHTHVNLNGREIASAIGDYTANRQAAR